MRIITLWTMVIILLLTNACKKEKGGDSAGMAKNDHDTAFVHPGLLHKQTDFDRMSYLAGTSSPPIRMRHLPGRPTL
jgi:hypothetical protein